MCRAFEGLGCLRRRCAAAGTSRRPPAMTTAPASKRVPARSSHVKRPSSGAPRSSATSWPRWNCGVERLDLLQQAVDQLLRAADRQRRDVVDGLLGIQLGCTGRPGAGSESIEWALMPSRPSSNTWNRPQGPAPMMTTSAWMAPSTAPLSELSVKKALPRSGKARDSKASTGPRRTPWRPGRPRRRRGSEAWRPR